MVLSARCTGTSGDGTGIKIVATVEFHSEQVIRMGIVVTLYQVHSQELVLPPLTKDKKRIHDEEPVASVAWRPALYVTNFREEMDDAQIRGVLSRFTKSVSGWFRFSVWYKPRCSLALKANRIHQKVLPHSIHVSGWFFLLILF